MNKSFLYQYDFYPPLGTPRSREHLAPTALQLAHLIRGAFSWFIISSLLPVMFPLAVYRAKQLTHKLRREP